jgi:RNA polymerase sigma-70 factor (ECF subfamily)
VLSSDDRIIERVQQGDRAAYLKLFDLYYPRVERYARWQLQDTETARDVASETFLRAYRHIGGYEVGRNSAYLPYLLQICRRLIFAEQDRLHSRPTYSLDDTAGEIDTLTDEHEVPLLYLLEEERRAMIQNALDGLSADDREIIHLAFERDLSRKDIATIMGKPSVTAVTSHLYRALQKLKVIVLQQGYFVAPYRVERK